MKKQLLTALSFLMFCIGLHAQTNIANYTFAKSIGVYTPLGSPTVLGAATAVTGATTSLDGTNYRVTFPAGFTFSFDGVAQTDLNINSNGYVGFSSAIWTGNTTSPLANTPTGGTTTGIISGFARDLNAVYNPTASVVGDISYELVGSAPDRKFIVQFKNFKPYSGTVDSRLVNFQIQLYESTHSTLPNNIDIVYGNCVIGDATATDIKVGLRGNSTTWTSNVNSLTIDNVPTGINCDWTNVVTSSSNTSNLIFTSANTNVSIPNGLTFRWAPPAIALAPVRVFSAVSGITSNGAVISWTSPTNALTYNVQYREINSCSWTNFSGNPLSTNSATLTGLNPLTVYQVRVQSVNGSNNAIWSHIPSQTGTGSGYSASGTFSTLALPTDLQTAALTAPGVSSTGCYGNSIPVVIQLKNAGSATLDFSTNNATIITNITGTNPQSFTTTVNTGTLAANATLNVTVTSTYDMSAAGVYSINAVSTLATPDANTANDAMPVVTRTTTAANPLPYTQDFAAGTLPAGWVNSSTWSFATNHGVTNFGVYKNLWSSATTASLSLLKLGTLNGSESISFDFRVLNYNSTYPGTQVPPTGNWGNVKIQVSTDCGGSYTDIGTIDNTTHTTTTQAWSNKIYSLAAFSGQNVIIRIVGNWVAGDYYIDFDNFNIASCFAPINLSVSNITTSSVDLSWNSPIAGTPVSYFGEVRTSGAPGSGTVGLVSSGSVPAPTTTASIGSLSPSTAYTIYAQSNCGGTDVSQWVPVTFTTLANCPVPTSLSTTSIGSSSVNFTWTAGGSETAWDVYYGVQPLSTPNATTAPTATSSTTSFSVSSLSPSTAYAFYVRSNCGTGNTSIWTPVYTFTTPCLPPNIVSTSGSSRCGVGTTTLSATADMGGTINWYTNSIGGAPVATGTLYTTPTITANTNYYVSAVGAAVNGSGARPAPTATSNTTPSTYGLVFDATSNFTLTSVDVYPTSTSGNLVVNLVNSTGAVLQTATVAIPTGTVGVPYTVNLNFPISTGTGYRLVAISGPSLIRESSLGGFPYQLGSVGSITSGYIGGTSTTYYFFYNWQFAYGCESARTMVTATVNTAPVLSVNNISSVCTDAIATLSVSSTLSDYDSYIWSPTTNLYSDASATVPYSGTNANTVYYKSSNNNSSNYTINASNSVSGCANSSNTSISATKPEIFATSNPTTVCSGESANLMADLVIPGNVAVSNGTLITTGSGSSSGNYVSPFSHWYGGYKAQYIFRASELTSLGLRAGNITALSFNVTSAGTNYNDFAISMAATTQSVASTTFNNSVAQVYTSASTTPSVGVNTYNFSSPFNWDGSSNVVIQICWSNNNGGGTAAEVNYASTSFASTSYYRVDNNTASAVCGQASATGTISSRPNISLIGPKVTPNATSINWVWNPGAVNNNSVTVNPVNTGSTTISETYTVTATDVVTTCTNSSVVSIAVKPLPSVNAIASSSTVCAGNSVTLTASGATNYTWTSGGNSATETVSPSTNGTYTVTGETAGCSSNATVSINVNAVPTLTISVSSSTICTGSSATLTASGANNYTWTPGNLNSASITDSPSANTTYTVSGEATGCSSSQTVSINVNALPNVNIIASNTLVCSNIGESATLTASTAANSYTWSTTENTASITVTPSVGTTYTLTVNDGLCEASTTIFVDAQVCSGLIENLSSNNISIYPNPNNGMVTVSITSNFNANTSLEVYDALGKLVIKETLTKENTSINTTDLKDGVYMFKVLSNNNTIKVGRMIKQ